MKKILTIKTFKFSFICLLAIICLVFLAAAPLNHETAAHGETSTNRLDFTIDTNGYIPGSTAGPSNIPSFTLTWKAILTAANMQFYYTTQDSGNLSDVDLATKDWTKVIDTDTADSSAELTLDGIVQANTIYTKFFYFKLSEIDGDSYTHPVSYEVRVDLTSGNDHQILSVNATYKRGGSDFTYNGAWVSTEVKYKIYGANPTVDNKNYYCSIDNNSYDIPVSIMGSATEGYYGELIFNEEMLKSKNLRYFSGNISFKCTDKNGAKDAIFDTTFSLNIDFVTPILGITANKENATNDSFTSGEWSDSDVSFKLALTDSGTSPIKVEYQITKKSESSSEWLTLTAGSSTNIYSLTIYETSSVKFRATSSAGKEYVSTDFAVNIDKLSPNLNITAKDYKNREILNNGFAQDVLNITLINALNGLPVANTAPLYFEYKLSTAADDQYSSANLSSGNYVVTLTAPIKNATYDFRIRSATGATSYLQYTYTVLKSDFSFEVDPLVLDETIINSNGWIFAKVPVYITLDNILNGASDYSFFYQYGSDTTLKQVFPQERVVNGDKVRFMIHIDSNMNEQKVLLKVKNQAGAEKSYEIPNSLKIDLSKPNAEVKKRINGSPDSSPVYISDEDWANGSVMITLNISKYLNISGVKAHKLLVGSEGLIIGTELFPKDNTFSLLVETTGIHRFRLSSGSGLYTDFTVNVNIEKLNNITLDSLILPENIEFTTVNGVVKPTKPLSSNFDIDFATNQYGHYTIWYRVFSDTLDSTFPTGYSEAPSGNQYSLLIPSGKSAQKYAFILESKAIDINNTKKFSNPIIFDFEYDTTVFDIGVSTTYQDGTWTFNDIEFTLENKNVSETISAYQYKIKPSFGSWGTEWISIPNSNMNTFNFTFSGLDRYSNGTKIGTSFNGNIQFRAIKASGHPSNIVGDTFNLKIDTCDIDLLSAIYMETTPNARIGNGKGEIVASTLGSENDYDYYIYNQGSIKLKVPNYETDPIMSQFAPLTFKYSASTNNPDNMTSLSGTSDGLSGRIYLFATRTAGDATKTATKTFSFVVDNSTDGFSGTLSPVGGAPNSDNIHVFDWCTEAKIDFSVVSLSDVYYWYKFGDESWTRYEEEPSQDRIKSLIFDDDMNKSVKFAITNRAGREYIFESKPMKIKIDKSDITFDLNMTVNGATTIDNKWYGSDINIEIVQTSVNPSGVVYAYSTNGIDYKKLPGNGTRFTSNLLEGENTSNGITVTFRGTVNAKDSNNGQKYKTIQKTIKVDKTTPTFTLAGLAKKEGSDSGVSNTVLSEQWVNADSIEIYKKLTLDKAYSKITYKYYKDASNEPTTWGENTTYIESKIIELYRVVAENEAGTTYTQTFQVNIDKTAPTISAGEIVNKYKDDGTIDYEAYNPYYIDQQITFVEDNLAEARFNKFTLNNNMIISTNVITKDDNGKVKIVVTDKAGNKAELVFNMIEFELDVNTITLSESHKNLLDNYTLAFEKAQNSLTQTRKGYFRDNIQRLTNRVGTLRTQVSSYQAFLVRIQSKVSFELNSDYAEMHKFITYFESNDSTIRYPEWQQVEILKGEYSGYFAKLKVEYDKLNFLMNEVNIVESAAILLPPMNIVKRTDYSEILKVYNAYLSLNRDQQSAFKSTLYVKLTEVKRRCEVLRLQDETTGISISGDNLSPGAMIDILSYQSTSEIYNNAQIALLQTVSEDKARAILSINKLSLSGNGSQNDTGRVLIYLPIPEEYRNYIQFAVYRLSPDGTISLVNGSVRNGDGKSVYFSSDSLDTYVLAAKANVTVRPPKSEIYGVIGGIEIDAKMLMYITFSVCGVFVVFVAITIIAGVRRKKFLSGYNKKHKKSLVARGVDRIPRGNKKPYMNPVKPSERAKLNKKIYKN